MKKINGFIKDTLGFFRVTNRRRNVIKKGDENKEFKDPIKELCQKVHPDKVEVKVVDIKESSLTSKTFTFKPLSKYELPPFQAGQYVSFELKIGNTYTTRPYSISSAPFEARQGEKSFFQVTIKKVNEKGFVADYFFDRVKVGDSFTVHLPFGNFHYDPLRDSKHLVCIAGGSGITPFCSMAKEVENGKLDVDLTILYGATTQKDMPLIDELMKLKSPKIKVVPVISNDENYVGEKGFITKECISKYSYEDSTFFVCGPQAMYKFIEKELDSLNVPKRRMIFESFGVQKEIKNYEDYPLEEVKKFKLTVVRGIDKTVIDANSDESIAVSLERAGIKNPTRCRAGECGVCRCKLLSGDVYIDKKHDNRRYADQKYGYIYACSTFPLSDCEIKINIIE